MTIKNRKLLRRRAMPLAGSGATASERPSATIQDAFRPRNDTDTGMTADNASLEAKLRLRAYYLWEADARPEGRLSEYWPKAQAMLDDEAKIAAPVDEATAAGALLTNLLHDRR